MEKNQTRRDIYLSRISSIISEDSAKFISDAKADALLNNAEYQAAKAKADAIKTAICTKVTNRIFANKLAKEFAPTWGMSTEGFLSLVIDENDMIYRDGKPYAITTIAQAASYMVYLHDSLNKKVSERQCEIDRIFSSYKGAKDLDMFTAKEIAAKVCKKHGITRGDLAKVLWTIRKRNQAVTKAKAKK